VTKWQLIEIETSNRIKSTSPETIEWLIGEIEKRSPELELIRRYDAEGLLYEVYGNSLDAKIQALVKRLLCQEGWEPYGYGADKYASYLQFKREVQPAEEQRRNRSRNSW